MHAIIFPLFGCIIICYWKQKVIMFLSVFVCSVSKYILQISEQIWTKLSESVFLIEHLQPIYIWNEINSRLMSQLNNFK